MNPIEEHLNSMFERKLINLSSKYRAYLVPNLGSIMASQVLAIKIPSLWEGFEDAIRKFRFSNLIQL
jgi:hypothetical protein